MPENMDSKILAIVKSDPTKSWSPTEIAQILFGQLPEGHNRVFRVIRTQVIHRAGKLVKRGFLEKNLDFAENEQSEISLNNSQLAILNDLMNLLYRFETLDPTVLEEGRQLSREIIADPTRVKNLIAKMLRDSPEMNKNKGEKTDSILQILQESPDISARDIQAAMQKRGLTVPTHNRIFQILDELKKKGVTEVTATKTSMYWRIKPQTTEEEA